MARASQLFLPTLRDAPADADAVSHKLLVRGGFIRQVGAGLFSLLPLGWRVHQKVVQIIREEINAIGGQEMLEPVLTPAELWQTSGRIGIPIVFKLKDRTGRDFVLPFSHEETMTFHARELQSYKQLPQVWCHFSTKERDEPRARGGLLRLREFIMKDSYSFDRDEAGLDKSFDAHKQAYERIWKRCGLEAYFVEAESGIMGGRESSGFMAPTESGENILVGCENGDYFADYDAARGIPRAPVFPEPLERPEEVETPGVATIEALAEFLGVDPAATSKAMPVMVGERPVLGLIRGDDRLSEEKLVTVLGEAYRPMTDEEIRAVFGAGGGSLGPVAVTVDIVADEALRDGQFVAGANRDGWHLRGVQAGRDYHPTFVDIRQANAGDACPQCGGKLVEQTAIELGHIFKLGTFYSVRFGATFLDEDGEEKPLVMGSYGVGPARTMAAIVEQHHDENGITWPRSVAPYDAHVVALPGVEQQAEEAATALDAAGLDVILDDREQRAGEKFADADLIGCPIRITVGRKTLEDGAVDVRDRASGDEQRVPIPELSGRCGSV
ncbi:MAG: proline--tRNA ligase [Actinobacteria bacterium]|nr:MAG: proline--tRNA ligase [Actinomycetota bacterium]